VKKRLMLYLLCTLSGCTLFDAGLINTFDGKRAPSYNGESHAVQSLLDKAKQAVEAGNLDAAMQHYDDMLNSGVRSPQTLDQYAISLRQHWHLEAALGVYNDALSLNENYAVTHWNLAIYYELYRGEFELALDHYRMYQQFSRSPDLRVTGWIKDLERRVAAQSGGQAQ